jgi:hypothetical protein
MGKGWAMDGQLPHHRRSAEMDSAIYLDFSSSPNGIRTRAATLRAPRSRIVANVDGQEVQVKRPWSSPVVIGDQGRTRDGRGMNGRVRDLVACSRCAPNP